MLLRKAIYFIRSGDVFPALAGLVLFPIVGVLLWGDVKNERDLIDHAQTVPATLLFVGTARDSAEGNYAYYMKDGTRGEISRVYDSLDEIPGNGNHQILKVEYLPERPDVKRVSGTGSRSVGEWKFWLALKCVLLGGLWIGSVVMLVLEYRHL
jgi:hypothetical protein